MTSRNNIEIRDERGQTMTEFAIVLPMLAMLLFGIIQFGILYNNYVTVTDAARAGAQGGGQPAPTPTTGATRPAPPRRRSTRRSSAARSRSPGRSTGRAPTSRSSHLSVLDLLLGVAVKSGTLVARTTERME